MRYDDFRRSDEIEDRRDESRDQETPIAGRAAAAQEAQDAGGSARHDA